MSSAANGLMYKASVDNISLTAAAQDLIELVAAATVGVLIHAIRITFVPTISSGIPQDVRAQLRFLARSTTGTGGVAVTPRPVNPRNTVAASATTTRTVTTPGTAGNVWDADTASVVVPFEKVFTPAQRIFVPAATRFCVNLEASIGTLAYSLTLDFEEL
jgi:hypothetical protein